MKTYRRQGSGLTMACAGALAMTAVLTMQGAEPAPPSAGSVDVDMPAYVVQENRILPAPQSWRYVRVPALLLERDGRTELAPGYEVLSNQSVKNTRVFVEELQKRQLAALILWPSIERALPRQPITVVLNRDAAPAADENRQPLGWTDEAIAAPAYETDAVVSSARGQAGNYWELNRPMFGSSDWTNPSSTWSGGFSRSADWNWDGDILQKPMASGIVVVRMRDGVVGTELRANTRSGISTPPSEERLAAGLSKELAVLGLRLMEKPPAPWFQEGLAWLVATTQVANKKITFAGAVVDYRGTRMISLMDVLKKETPLNFDEGALAAAFTHYCLYANRRKLAPAFTKFIERLEREPLSEKLFTECLGRTPKKMEVEVASQGRMMAAFDSIEFRGKLPALPAFEVREANQAEVARLKSDMLLSQDHADRALDELRIAYWRGEREPQMLASLAALELRLGSEARARKIAAALLALPVPPRKILVVDARLRFRDALAPESARGKLSTKETQAILSRLAQAIAAGERSEELWDFFSQVVLKSAGKPHDSIKDFLHEAGRHYPKNPRIQEALAYVEARS